MATLKLGESLIPFELQGVDGRKHSTASYRDKPVLAVIFWCNHCPYVQAWEDRVLQLQRRYAGQGVQLLLVSANDPKQYPDDDFPAMQRRAQEKQYPAPYLWDETQQVARAYGASRTPEVFLFDRERRLRYHGRPDDNYEDPAAVRHHYLRDAIEALLAGREPAVGETEPQGCTIKWRR
ncbi:thioredoxin family protein [Carboxydochorda subterranea]|uniref:Thioredoxin family protein n=1 Tax=Carboxydichorda subterranea TaxID=3109565 RepID=A0ABZ1BVI9_9FIRM|nr:thioredoxin family protein [Limnochorda sp. L945t]WRP16147.1 thioredoxin family protein [Limnochorda sp. L945t]